MTDSQDDSVGSCVSRRQLLAGTGSAALAALAGCTASGRSDDTSTTSTSTTTERKTQSDDKPTPSFVFESMDHQVQVGDPITVTLRIEKPDGVTYSDDQTGWYLSWHFGVLDMDTRTVHFDGIPLQDVNPEDIGETRKFDVFGWGTDHKTTLYVAPGTFSVAFVGVGEEHAITSQFTEKVVVADE